MKKIALIESPCSDLQKRVADEHKYLNIKILFSPDGKKTYAKAKGKYVVEINLEERRLTGFFNNEVQFYYFIFFGSAKKLFLENGEHSFIVGNNELIYIQEWCLSHGITPEEISQTVDEITDFAIKFEESLTSSLPSSKFINRSKLDYIIMPDKDTNIPCVVDFGKIVKPEIIKKWITIHASKILSYHYKKLNNEDLFQKYDRSFNFLFGQLSSMGLTDSELIDLRESISLTGTEIRKQNDYKLN